MNARGENSMLLNSINSLNRDILTTKKNIQQQTSQQELPVTLKRLSSGGH